MENEVYAAFEKCKKAYLDGDAASLGGVLADDWMLITAHGNVSSKARQLKHLEFRTLKVVSIDDSEVKCRVYGNAAVITGLRRSRVTLRKRDLSGVTRFSQVYARHDKQWRCVSSQVSSLEAAERQ